MLPRLVAFTTLCFISCLSFAEESKPEDKPHCEAPLSQPREESVVTSHTVTIDGKEISYTAKAGTLLFKDDAGKPKAELFYVSYSKDKPEEGRPVAFCFNGGPGSCSVWLHLGLLGPKKVLLDSSGVPVKPFALQDNAYSLLDMSDLVFIDPISTGYSKTLCGEDPKKYYGYEEDIQSVGEFIRLYLTKENRWTSPKFVIGESYGTTRAVGLSSYLYNNKLISIDGIILISSVLNFQTLSLENGPFSIPSNDLPFYLSLPSYTATAAYYKLLPQEMMNSVKDTLKEVEEFVLHDYAEALLQGNALSPDKRNAIIAKLCQYTGLSSELIDRLNLRIDTPSFTKEILRKQGKVVGRFDTTYAGISANKALPCAETDPCMDAITTAFTATINNYLRQNLGWKEEEEYQILANVFPWKFGSAMNQYLDVSVDLATLLSQSPSTQVFLASGIYDLATPYFATDYTLSHLPLDPRLQSHVTHKLYPSGHMMYLHQPSLIKLKQDMASFIQATTSPAGKKPLSAENKQK